MTPVLTRELVKAAFPDPVADDKTAMPLMPADDIAASRATFMADVAAHAHVWLFAYGSLMWKPEFEFVRRMPAALHGHHRSFCLWQWRFRGTRERPGLMMALDQGGHCDGFAYQISGPDASGKLAEVWTREMIGMAYVPAWIELDTSEGRIRAMAFLVNRSGTRYAGKLDEAEQARLIAQACGHLGPSSEYLYETWNHCVENGINDPMLERLQGLVAGHLLQSAGRV